MRPAPEHVAHGSSITSPRPMHEGQVRSMVKKPWLARTLPWPPHVAQGLGLVPALAPVPEHVSQEMLVGKHVVGDEVITKNIAGPRSGVLRCDWGYALTVHKAQGSEWGRVLVVDHGAYDKVGQKSWNYVALTRARNTVSVVRLRKDSALLG